MERHKIDRNDIKTFGLSGSMGLRRVQARNDKYGLIDEDDYIIAPAIYMYVGAFNEGLVRVERDSKWGYVDTEGNEVIPCIYALAGDFHEGLVYVQKPGSKIGFINKRNEVVIPFYFDIAWNFYNCLTQVKLNGVLLFVDSQLNYYDRNTKERIKCEDCVCYNDYLTTKLCCKFGRAL